jgi:hypothetical protein
VLGLRYALLSQSPYDKYSRLSRRSNVITIEAEFVFKTWNSPIPRFFLHLLPRPSRTNIFLEFHGTAVAIPPSKGE